MRSDISKLKNTFTALISPMDNDGDLQKDTYLRFIQRQIDAGCGLVPCGTTGEASTMSHQEHEAVVRWCVNLAKNSSYRPFVLAGSGSNSTAEAISLSRHIERMGVDGLLIITPYYNKPTQNGLIAHYSAIAETVDIPIVVYNVPSRTGTNILPETVATLAEKYENIVGYKAASGNLAQIQQVIEQTSQDFIVMSGDDAKTLDIMRMGGKGVISVASNLIPSELQQMTSAMSSGDPETAEKIHQRYAKLFEILFIETNPGPVKFGAELMQLMNRRMRLPLVPPTLQSQQKIQDVLQNLGVI